MKRTGAVSWVVFLLAVTVWALFLRPGFLGGTTAYVIVSGNSMEPVMHTGDLAVVRRERAYRPGDVVAYRIPDSDVGAGLLVIHRVIGGDAQTGLLLQGDNREHPDVWRPRSGDVVGRLQWHVPNLGTVLFLLRSPMVLAAVAGFLGFWAVAMRDTPSAARDDNDLTEAPPEGALEPLATQVGEPASATRGGSDVLHVRMEMLAGVEAGDMTVMEACRRYDISRSHFYELRKRYRTLGEAGLVRRSRQVTRPARHAPPALVAAIVAHALAHPTQGSRTIAAAVASGCSSWSVSHSTVYRVLVDHGLNRTDLRLAASQRVAVPVHQTGGDSTGLARRNEAA